MLENCFPKKQTSQAFPFCLPPNQFPSNQTNPKIQTVMKPKAETRLDLRLNKPKHTTIPTKPKTHKFHTDFNVPFKFFHLNRKKSRCSSGTNAAKKGKIS